MALTLSQRASSEMRETAPLYLAGKKLMSLLRVGEVHDEHDPALVLLDVPLVGPSFLSIKAG